MQSCQAYQSCPVCTHEWTPGSVLGRKGCVCDGYRRFLAKNSRARDKSFRFKGHKYEYRFNMSINCSLPSVIVASCYPLPVTNPQTHYFHIGRAVETRGKPAERDDACVRTACSIATEKKPFLGHKTPPLLCR